MAFYNKPCEIGGGHMKKFLSLLLALLLMFSSAACSQNVNKNDDVTVPDVNSNLDVTDMKISDNFVLIKGGSFQMGNPESEAWRSADETQHSVTVSDFYMSKYELTQKEYEEITGSNPSNFSGKNLPVENVSWLDAVAYCNAKSEKENLTPAYTINGQSVSWDRSANGYRLPTEAEWEYACRAGTTTPFYMENSPSAEEANYYGHYPYGIEDNYFSPGNLQVQPGEYRQTTVDVGSFNIGIRLVRNAEPGTGSISGAGSHTTGGSGEGKILIAYFSWGGNTKGIAEEIQSKTGADLFEITMVNPYSSDYNTVLDEAQRDQKAQTRPELASHVENMAQYDIVMIGYPNWWASIPMPIASFLEEYDFSGKVILPFCSHGGGRFGQSLTAIAKLAPNAAMGDALSIHYSGGSELSSDVTDWLNRNGIKYKIKGETAMPESPETGERKLKLTIAGQEFPTTGEPNEFDPDIGDLCLYAPWGNLSIFYKDFRISNGLISLGHIDSGIEVIANMQSDFSVTLSKNEN